ncbi:MAG: FAD-dependent oxidoreductase [Candidatus Eisenbacteria bacterium]|nr:FAD-dependent oxidoreductase [Candidatus Eisenbacteria bacterium]
MRERGRLVVVGGVAAGMSAASRARRLRPDVEIVVLEKGADVSYGACLLPYFVSGLIENRDDLVHYDADFFRRERGIDVRLNCEATGIDPRRREVAFRGPGGTATVGYDALVLASGAAAIKPPIPGIDMPGVVTLRTLTDGEALKDTLMSGRVSDAVIIGAGYIGLEMAEALTTRGVRVTVIEMLPTVLSTYDADMSELVERELMDNGVVLRKRTEVRGFEHGEGTDSIGYVVAGEQRIRTDLALVSVGVRPSSRLAKAAGLELGTSGAIRVDARQVTSEPSILAAGDCCEAPHVVTGKPCWIPLGTTANKQGKIAGENSVGGSVRFGGVAGTNVTKIFGLEAAQAGLSQRGAELAGFRSASVRITSTSRARAYPGSSPLHVKLIFAPDTGRLLGGQIVGREGAAKRIDTIAAALHAKMSVGELADIDMSYAPPFSPVWDPVIMAASQARKKVVD